MQLVGRNREVETLSAALEDACAGYGVVAVLTGPAGIGKTRLADETERLAGARRFRTVWGRCWEAGGAPVYWPWVQVLRAICRTDRTHLERLGATQRHCVLRLLPELGPAEDASAALDQTTFRFALFDGVAQLLSMASIAKPLLIVLDDMHAADPGSLGLLEFVVRSIRAANALLLITFREVEAGQRGEIGEGLWRVAREGRHLALGPLDRTGVARLAAIAGDTAVDEVQIDQISQLTEGNPLFVAEMLRAQRRRLERPKQSLELSVPATIKGAISERLRHLSDRARQILAAAAVLGREFSPSLVAELVPPGFRPALNKSLDQAVELEVLERFAGPRVRFSHILFREVLYEDLASEQRRALHRRAGAVLLARNDPEVLSEAAHHLSLGATADSARPAAWVLARAGLQASQMGAPEQAAPLLAQALVVLDRADESHPRERFELLTQLTIQEHDAGHLGAARGHGLEAVEAARRLDDPRALARAALAYGASFSEGRVDDRLVRLLREAEAELSGGNEVLRAEVLARLAAALQPCPDPGGPIAMAHQALDLARPAARPEAWLRVLYSAGSALMDMVPAAERLPINRELDRVAAKLGHRSVQVRALLRLIFDHVELGDLIAVDQTIGRLETLANELRQPRHLWLGCRLRAMRAILEGRFAEADALGLEADGHAAQSEVGNATMVRLSQKLAVASLRRDAERALSLVEEMVRLMGSFAVGEAGTTAILAREEALDGRHERARALLAKISASEVSQIARYDACIGTAVAEAIALADPSAGRAQYEWLLKQGDGLVSWGPLCLVAEGPRARLLGLLAAGLGERREAEGHFERALDQCRDLGLRPWLAVTAADYARTLRQWQRRPEVASQLEELAREIATELGQTGLIDALPAPGRERPAAALDRSARDAETGSPSVEREGEVWCVTAGPHRAYLPDLKGVHFLARLLHEPGREIHVLELVGEGSPGRDSDAGETLDDQAIQAYRRRAEELRTELEQAETWADLGRAEHLRAELDALTDELSRAVGLGGRRRRDKSHSERARINVQRRLRDVLDRLAEQAPQLAEHLNAAVKTGTVCVYDPTRA